MMKKLLVLALVLSVASLANAGLSLVVAPDNSSVSLVGSDFATALATTNFLVFAIDAGTPVLVYTGAGSALTDVSANNAAFAGAIGIDGALVKSSWMTEIKDTVEPFLAPNGTLITTAVSGTGTVYLLDETAGILSSVQIVPEPATMVLLGLGALVLRRKK